MGVEVKACGDISVVRVVVVFACAETGQVKRWLADFFASGYEGFQNI